MAMVKRSREEYESDVNLAMANYLIMLSRGSSLEPTGRVFECKTCNRRFPSFQALGGHRASHKKPKQDNVLTGHDHDQMGLNQGKPKTHECSICGLEFAIGQALGGHMRRHRASLTGSRQLPALSLALAVGSGKLGQQKNGGNNKEGDDRGKRVKCLDLNLTPLENRLSLDIGMLSPIFCLFGVA
ncbi:hypothetical protein Cgig2_025396 [Carnegiea gigantea]|uniref:C2H2-type domain-containing protein n=1 Tax=Carnegiea gigantea TaxID=171969 RepID=A0A9Q1JJP2_9CARY|nr:hypothetical protein Cgig2_025396 [Carnegiea gigantea]